MLNPDDLDRLRFFLAKVYITGLILFAICEILSHPVLYWGRFCELWGAFNEFLKFLVTYPPSRAVFSWFREACPVCVNILRDPIGSILVVAVVVYAWRFFSRCMAKKRGD